MACVAFNATRGSAIGPCKDQPSALNHHEWKDTGSAHLGSTRAAPARTTVPHPGLMERQSKHPLGAATCGGQQGQQAGWLGGFALLGRAVCACA